MYTVITENDVSQWNDETGLKYHFPKRYLKFLQQGTNVVYYKGKQTDKKFKDHRLSAAPHYFGLGVIEKLEQEEGTTNYYAAIKDFVVFAKAVPFKINDTPIEVIPENKKANYWRNGVRPINEKIYQGIISLANIIQTVFNDQKENDLVSVYTEGGKKKIYTTVYERDKNARDEAIFIHGYTCSACGFNFKEVYGEWGEGYIHVHHKNPLSTTSEKIVINPLTDLDVVCANCHSMIHRRKDIVLKMDELKKLLNRNRDKK